jgi:uncharacterized membrane protein YeaQ/YmgE (transglycosylase-associated protein family)
MATPMDWFYLLLVGLIAGWVAGKLMKGRGFGLVGNLVVGVLGALVGGFLFHALGFAAYGFAASLIMAVVGSMVLLVLVGFIKKA